METVPSAENLETLLKLSVHGQQERVKAFFTALLISDIFLVSRPAHGEESAVVELGKNPEAATSWVRVSVEGRVVIPIFTDSVLALTWFGQEHAKIEEVKFTRLINSIGPEVWLHLNPESDFGKEFSPWEIERLRDGEAAIAEIIDELEFEAPPGLEVTSHSSSHSELKRTLRGSLELFSFVTEAFLLEVENEKNELLFVLGVCTAPHSVEDRNKIREEISYCVSQIEELKGCGFECLIDLWHSPSPYRELFRDQKPFYFAREELPSRKRLFGFAEFRKKLGSLFTRTGGDSPSSLKR
jgi:hypothetical protein